MLHVPLSIEIIQIRSAYPVFSITFFFQSIEQQIQCLQASDGLLSADSFTQGKEKCGRLATKCIEIQNTSFPKLPWKLHSALWS